jgi:hypothetical protein
MNQAAATQVASPVTTPDGLVIHPDMLYRGLAKLDAAGKQLPADATDHAIVYDPLTGLMEAIRAPGFDKHLDHDAATTLASQLTFAGYSDWQLPDVPEAVHSVDYTREEPAADPLLYPDAESTWYWTRQQTAWTKDKAGSSRSFFLVYMLNGDVHYDYAGNLLRARPVRRASPASQCLVIGQ